MCRDDSSSDWQSYIDEALARVTEWKSASLSSDLEHPAPLWSELTQGHRPKNRLRSAKSPRASAVEVGLDASERVALVRDYFAGGVIASAVAIEYAEHHIRTWCIAYEGSATNVVRRYQSVAQVADGRVTHYEVRYAIGGTVTLEYEWSGDKPVAVGVTKVAEGQVTRQELRLQYAPGGALTLAIDQDGHIKYREPLGVTAADRRALERGLAETIATCVAERAPDGPVAALILEFDEVSGLPPLRIALATAREQQALAAPDLDHGDRIASVWAAEQYSSVIRAGEIEEIMDVDTDTLNVVNQTAQMDPDRALVRSATQRMARDLARRPWPTLDTTDDFTVAAIDHSLETVVADVRATASAKSIAQLEKRTLL